MPPKATDNSKLDTIIDQLRALEPMRAKIDDLHASLVTLREEVGSVQFTVNQHEDRLTALEGDMLEQKAHANHQQQLLRSLTLRLLNVPVSTGEAANNFAHLRTTVYQRFISPTLKAAGDAPGTLSITPPQDTVIESCFRPYPPATGKLPPPVIIKLASKHLKILIMKNRKALPRPSQEETASGINRFILVEDLTPDNHRVLTALTKSKYTGKVWSVDGHIKFTLVDKPNEVRTVKSVFDPIEKILNL